MPAPRLCQILSLDDFLNFDGPTGVTVTPDDSRSNFFLHIGLSEKIYRHRVLYRRMRREAKAGMTRLFENRKCLQPDVVNDVNVVPPYTVKEISEQAFQREVERIYERASRQTKGIYDLTRTDVEGNWVIRWMLWRVIRCRQTTQSRAASNYIETEFSVPSVCATSLDWNFSTSAPTPATTIDWGSTDLPTPHFVKDPSPYWPASTAPPHEFSDSEEWDEDAVKIKTERGDGLHPKYREPHARRSGFWDHVL